MRGLDFGGGSKIARFNNFAKKLDPPFFFKCHPRPILGTRSSSRGLHDLRKWVFRGGGGVQNRAVLTILEKNCMGWGHTYIQRTSRLYDRIGQRSTRPPEVGVSRWHRHTYTQTYTRTWRLYDQLGPVGPSW